MKPFALAIVLIIGTAVSATPAVAAARLAILEPENLTDSPEVPTALTSRLLHGLRQEGVGIEPMFETRAALRKARIRSVGQISREGAMTLRETCGATHVLVWSILYFQEQPPYETTLSARLVDCADGRLVGAWNVARSSGQELDWIGSHVPSSRDETARRSVDELSVAIAQALRTPPPRSGGSSIAVVALDAWTRDRRDAVRATRLLASALFDAGLQLIESGEVSDALVRAGWSAQGAIPAGAARELGASLGAEWVLTGSIDTFALGGGASGETPPRLACGLRLVRAADASPVWAVERNATGADRSGFFGRGREPALGGLSHHLFYEIGQDLPITSARQ